MTIPEDAEEMRRLAAAGSIWRFSLQSGIRMTVYKPRDLAFA
jgi:hypothetical protein